MPDFPKDFLWGSSTAAHQVEGGNTNNDWWAWEHAEGTACVIGAAGFSTAGGRVQSLTPELAKGLEFDLVVLVDPGRFGNGVQGAVDRYVAMTRATQQLVILTSS